MSGRIPVSSPRAVQLVAIAGALVLLANAFFVATEGRNFPPYRCPPPWKPPVSYLLRRIRFGVGPGSRTSDSTSPTPERTAEKPNVPMGTGLARRA